MQDENEKSLEDLINNALDESVEELSPEVQRRLTPMRVIASQAAEKNTSGFGTSWKLATAFTVVVAVSVSWNLWPEIDPNNISVELATAEVSPFDEVLQEDLEMLDELEFVYWMAEENAIDSLSENDGETAIL
jgi:hypothetical protein